MSISNLLSNVNGNKELWLWKYISGLVHSLSNVGGRPMFIASLFDIETYCYNYVIYVPEITFQVVEWTGTYEIRNLS